MADSSASWPSRRLGETPPPHDYFLTADSVPGVAQPYFVMQFERPIVFVGLSISDYTGVGGSSRFDLLAGDDLASTAALPEYVHRPDVAWPPYVLEDGGFLHLVGSGRRIVRNFRPSFNFAVLRLDPADATVGFDNVFVINAVPQPSVLTLLLAGLGALAATRRRSAAGTTPGAADACRRSRLPKGAVPEAGESDH
ncbi:PEP-CTERM sorting domain-containing protein [Accumulibacter sp.]|uniref:PEP-CTERM sorting domain-containing protein n=1 Tax=Accumulibacter sp. TaxID=2053492 RepID=UPI002626571B|nr:PEP-CTERM sorting domain-containing protein [Accumulibacter sp.]